MSNFSVADFQRVADAFWPVRTAESWDRVGLVSGRGSGPLRRVLLAVDAVAAIVDEAVRWDADLLFTHHPLLLRGVHSVAEDTGKGEMLARLIRSDCALYAAHTNADITPGGVSDVLARRLGVIDPEPIVPSAEAGSGIGRTGLLSDAVSLREFAERVAEVLPSTVSGVRVAGDPERMVRRVALLGGAGDSLLDHPSVRAADVYLTSDLRHHPAQESIELSRAAGGPALIDVAHWASESLWLQGAADRLSERFPGVEFLVSTQRTDPWTFSIGAEPR